MMSSLKDPTRWQEPDVATALQPVGRDTQTHGNYTHVEVARGLWAVNICTYSIPMRTGRYTVGAGTRALKSFIN